MAFHVGQKVVCVDPAGELVKDAIYTVSAVGLFGKKLMIDVEGIDGYHPYAWYPERFRPLIDRKSSISFTEGAPKDSETWDNRRKVEVGA